MPFASPATATPVPIHVAAIVEMDVWCFAWSPLGKTLHALTAADRLCSKSTLEPSTNGRRWLFCALPAAAHGYSLWASISCVLEAWHIPLAFTANFGRSRDSALQVCMLCRSKQSVFLFLELPHPVHWSCGTLYLVAKAFRHTAGDYCSSNQCSQSMSIDSAVGGSLGRTMYHVPLYMVLQPLGCKRAWWRHSKYSQNDQVHLLTADIGVLTTPSCFDIQFPGGKYIIDAVQQHFSCIMSSGRTGWGSACCLQGWRYPFLLGFTNLACACGGAASTSHSLSPSGLR